MYNGLDMSLSASRPIHIGGKICGGKLVILAE